MDRTTKEPGQAFVLEVGRGELIGASIMTGLLGFVVGLVLFYVKAGEHEWLKISAQAGGLGIFVAVATYLRCGVRKHKRIAVDDDGIEIENERERLMLKWSEIDGISHWVHGDHYWEFRSRNQLRPLVLKGFGFGVKDCKRLSEAINHFKTISEEQPGLKRILEDAFVH